MKPGLSALISPMTTEEFFSIHWPAVPFATHALDVRTLAELPFLHSLEALLGLWPDKIQAHLPDHSDEISAIDTTPRDARKLFANHIALLFNNVQAVFPVLNEWLESLRSDLGLPMMTHARCMIYATPDGKGTAPHFDQNINFVLQIRGTKKWRLAANDHIENPTQRHTMGLPLDPELAPYASDPMPEQMPKDTFEIVLKPGSMLFVPRGFWHSTEAEGEALALNFTFSQPTWSDLFLAALKSRLTLSPEWRALADGVTSQDLNRREKAAATLDILLLDLAHDLPNWQAIDILAATEGQ